MKPFYFIDCNTNTDVPLIVSQTRRTRVPERDSVGRIAHAAHWSVGMLMRLSTSTAPPDSTYVPMMALELCVLGMKWGVARCKATAQYKQAAEYMAGFKSAMIRIRTRRYFSRLERAALVAA
jgi:hypothetical protein